MRFFIPALKKERLHHIEHLLFDLLKKVFHTHNHCLHLGMIALRSESVDFATHFLSDETELFALSGLRCIHRLDKVSQMLREALLLLVDIKLLYVKYHLLLQAPLVVLGNRNLRQAFFDTRAYFSDSLLLVKVDSSQQFAYSLDALGKEPLKSLSFGTTVSHKTLHCRRHCLGKSRSIGVMAASGATE